VWTEIPRIRVRDCSCFWSSLSNDKLGSFPKASELLGCGSEHNDSPTSPLLASATPWDATGGSSLADQPAYLWARRSCSCCLSFCSVMNRLITMNSYTMLASTIIIATAITVIVLMRARSSSVSADAHLLMQPAVSSRIGAS
jgi:hypothetical protein